MFYELDQSIADAFSVFTYVIMAPIWGFIIVFACRQMWKLYKRRKSNGQKSWYFILLYSTITFVLVTGNWLPNDVYFEYLCRQLSEDNLKIYKTPEEWVKENQDSLSGKDVTLKINNKSDVILPEEFHGAGIDISYNGYFTFVRHGKKIFSRIGKTTMMLIDNRTGKVLMSINFFTKSQRFHSPPLTGTVLCRQAKYSEFYSIEQKFLKIK